MPHERIVVAVAAILDAVDVEGAHTAMDGCVGGAGSTRIGEHCTFGGAAMINGHIEIAGNVHTAATMVPNSINEPGRYAGYYPVARGASEVRQ